MPSTVKGAGRGNPHSVVANRDLLLSSSALRAPPPREDSIAKHPHLAGTPSKGRQKYTPPRPAKLSTPLLQRRIAKEGNFRTVYR